MSGPAKGREIQMSNVVMLTMRRDGREGDDFDLGRAVDLSPTAITYWDRDLKCVYANEACRDWLRLDPEILVGCELGGVLDVLELQAHFALVDAALQGEPRTVVQAFHEGAARRDGLVQYVPDGRGHQVRGFLLQIGPLPPAPRFPRADR